MFRVVRLTMAGACLVLAGCGTNPKGSEAGSTSQGSATGTAPTSDGESATSTSSGSDASETADTTPPDVAADDVCAARTDPQTCQYGERPEIRDAPAAVCRWAEVLSGADRDDALGNARTHRCVLFPGSISTGCFPFCPGTGNEYPRQFYRQTEDGIEFMQFHTCGDGPYYEEGWIECDERCECLCVETGSSSTGGTTGGGSTGGGSTSGPG